MSVDFWSFFFHQPFFLNVGQTIGSAATPPIVIADTHTWHGKKKEVLQATATLLLLEARKERVVSHMPMQKLWTSDMTHHQKFHVNLEICESLCIHRIIKNKSF